MLRHGDRRVVGQAVPDAIDGRDELRLAEFVAQPADVHVHRARTGVHVTPHLRQQLAAREDLAWVRGEEHQQVELQAAQVEQVTRPERGPRLGFDTDRRPVPTDLLRPSGSLPQPTCTSTARR